MKRILTALLIAAALVTGCSAPELNIYVSPLGDDANPGTEQHPFASLTQAQKAVTAAAGKSKITVFLRQGSYYLTDPVVFTPRQSGSARCPILYTVYPGEKVVVSGAAVLKNLQWQPYRDGIMQTPANLEIAPDQLYVNGQLQQLARYPNFDSTELHYNGYAPDATAPARVAHWKKPAGGYIHALHRHEWGGYQYRITGKTDRNELTLEGGYQNNRPMGMHDRFRMVENIFEELDAPGEWFYDNTTQTLYFYPPQGLDLATALIEVPQTESLFEITGNQQQPVRYVTLNGMELRQTLRTFMKTREPLLRSDWTIYRGGAVRIEGAEHCAVTGCFMHQIGGNGIFVSNYNREHTIASNHLAHIGASGICFVGSPTAVRSACFEYAQAVSPETMDTIPGPANDNYPARCTVFDNLIHDAGRIEKQVAGVQISMSRNITVSHNSIYNLPRAGINISEGTWGGHLIEGNDVFNTVLETGDHGSFNAWGRDRFWRSDREAMDSLAKAHRSWILLDAVETTVIRDNRWRCDHGWDIDLDDGASNYHVYNNLCLNGGLKLREGFHRTVENNIMVNNSFHPHAWFENSDDRFRHNIVTRHYYPIAADHWGYEVDYNLLPDSLALAQAHADGTDRHSLAGDPQFIDPATGDYRVNTDSPALKIGFKNFDMNRFGVVSEKLRAIAQTPELPLFQMPTEEMQIDAIFKWLGASFKNILTEGERSVAGMDSARGIFVLGVPKSTPLAEAGLRINDVILKYNGTDTDRWTQMQEQIDRSKSGETVTLTIFRNQHPQILSFRLP